MKREEAISALDGVLSDFCLDCPMMYEENCDCEAREAIDMAIEALSTDAEPKMTEEVREALMRLTMCAREECGMCKYKDKCGFEFQYNISTENMNTILEALSADTVSREEYEELYRKAKEVNGMANDILADFPRYKELFAVVRCKDCKHYIVEGITTRYGWCHEYKHSVNEDDYCSYGEREK